MGHLGLDLSTLSNCPCTSCGWWECLTLQVFEDTINNTQLWLPRILYSCTRRSVQEDCDWVFLINATVYSNFGL